MDEPQKQETQAFAFTAAFRVVACVLEQGYNKFECRPCLRTMNPGQYEV
jgi:hypothetical protein